MYMYSSNRIPNKKWRIVISFLHASIRVLNVYKVYIYFLSDVILINIKANFYLYGCQLYFKEKAYR